MSYATVPDFTGGTELTAAELNVLVDAFNALFPVGMYGYMCRAATTSETLVNGVWLECNSTSVLRATYPDLNTLFSSLSYPFGSADGTHMTLPDAQGRALVSMASGGHTDVDGLGDSDGGAKSNRSFKHAHTVSLSGGSHTHSAGSLALSSNGAITSGTGLASGTALGTTGNSIGGSTGANTSSVSGTVGLSGRLTDSGSYLVGGTLFIKAKA